jgi:hypothetical protein
MFENRIFNVFLLFENASLYASLKELTRNNLLLSD